MKKYLVFVLVMLILLPASIVFADDSIWILNGKWSYRATIPTTVLISGDTVSATETGTIAINMTNTDNMEYFNNYSISGKGTAVFNGASYSYEYPSRTYTLTPTRYIPGETAVINDSINIASLDVTAKVVYELVQTGANTVAGTMVMTWGSNTASGAVVATRIDEDKGGGCNAGLAGLALLAIVPLFYRKKK